MSKCFVALGANQGQSSKSFDLSRQMLEACPEVSGVVASHCYRSHAMGESAGDDFLNAVVSLESSLDPQDLLTLLHKIEGKLGRRRDKVWGPRVIDLDLLYVGDLQITTSRLLLPHPHAWYRRFVLVPMCDVAAEFVHPVLGLSQKELCRRLDVRPLGVRLAGFPVRREELSRLGADYPEIEVLPPLPVEEGSASLTLVSQGDEFPAIDLTAIPASSLDQAARSVLDACLSPIRRLSDVW